MQADSQLGPYLVQGTIRPILSSQPFQLFARHNVRIRPQKVHYVCQVAQFSLRIIPDSVELQGYQMRQAWHPKVSRADRDGQALSKHLRQRLRVHKQEIEVHHMDRPVMKTHEASGLGRYRETLSLERLHDPVPVRVADQAIDIKGVASHGILLQSQPSYQQTPPRQVFEGLAEDINRTLHTGSIQVRR